MAKNKEEKTNVMRTLEQKKIAYTAKTYPHGEGDAIDGVSVARAVGLEAEMVFKTLVCKGASGGYYVFDIPVAENLDLKKAARAVGEKSVAMLPQKELLPLTGYVHGGNEEAVSHGVSRDGGEPFPGGGFGGEDRIPGGVRPQGPDGAAAGRRGGPYCGVMKKVIHCAIGAEGTPAVPGQHGSA
jgi:hypothetical protein